MINRIKDKADAYCSYDLYECRKRKSEIPEARHQKEAIMASQEWMENKTFPAGTILALPTGSGKTFTAIRFLCKYPLTQGYKVLWLAHTHHLLEQAFFSFGPGNMKSKDGYEVGWITEGEKLNVRIVSGSSNHSDVHDIKKTDNIVIATLQTIVSAYNNPKKNKSLMDFLNSANGKIFVIFDEAHHSPAPSYRKLLIGDESDKVPESLRELFPKMFLLGLTATPTYTDLKKRGWLKDIFPQKIINADSKKFHSSINDLMIEEILAKPNLKEIETNFDPKIDDREYQQLTNRYKKDVPERIIKRIANNKERNQVIVNNYDKKRCGKTIIFTDYVDQCEQINTFLKNRNKNLKGNTKIRSDVMYSARSDEENEDVLQKFRDDELDVVINIRMLTEGTDVPDVNTVFITRQTTSEILLTQMVGRALRGPRFGGTETANLVFFIDDWKKLINWASWDPDSWTVKGIIKDYHSGPWDLVSVALIQKIIRIIGGGGNNKGEYLRFMPLGWYVVEYDDFTENKNETEPLKVRDFVLIFDNDQDNYAKLVEFLSKNDIARFDDDKIKYSDFKQDLKKLRDEFFPEKKNNIGRGLKKNIFKIARHMAQDKHHSIPKFVLFKERQNYDMDVLAKKNMKYDREVENQKLLEIYNNPEYLWKTLYYDYDHFKSQYNACVEWLLSQQESEIVDIDDHTVEEKLVIALETGSSIEKIAALNKLGVIGSQEHLHQDTIKLIYSVSEKEKNSKIKNAAKNAFDIIKRDLTPSERKFILKRDHYRCLCCGETEKRILQIDHILPRSLGGKNSPDNLQTLCGKCNGGVKKEEIIDFRITSSPRKKPKENLYGLGNRYINEKSAKDVKFWNKLVLRNINIFYNCKSVKSADISFSKAVWSVELYHGNNASWVGMEIDSLVNEINDKLAEFNLKKLKSIKIKLEPLNKFKMPPEYEKLWKKYSNHPSRLTDKEKDKLADYMNRFGLP